MGTQYGQVSLIVILFSWKDKIKFWGLKSRAIRRFPFHYLLGEGAIPFPFPLISVIKLVPICLSQRVDDRHFRVALIIMKYNDIKILIFPVYP